MRDVLWEVLVPYRVVFLGRAILARPRLVMWIEVALVLYAVMVLAAPPAEAAPPNPLEALDREDSSGYMISDYNLTYLTSNLRNPGEGMTAWIVGILWEGYRWGVGIAALIIDLTIGFAWLDYLVYPVEQVALVLDDLLDQLPFVRQLLITLAIAVGILRLWLGQVSRGVMDMIGSLTAWGIGAAVVTNPVTWITGPEGVLTRTQQAAQQFSAQLVNPAAGAGEVEQSEAAGSIAKQLATTFVRGPHQYVAYGGLADGGGCEGYYNDNLTNTGKELAEEMAKCSPDFAQNIEHPDATTLVTMLIILVGAFILIGLAMVCSAFILLEAVNILIAAMMGVWELFRAVGPGGSYRGLLGLFIDAFGAILAMLLVILGEALYLAAVHHLLTTWDQNMIVIFLIVDMVLIVMLIVIFKQRRKLARHLERMKERAKTQKTQATGPKKLPSFGHGGVAAGLSHAAGQRAAGAAGRVGSKVARGSGHAAKGMAGAATAPARSVGRRVSRPGFMAAQLGTGLAKRAGIHDRTSHRAIRGLAYRQGERKWEKAETKRTKRQEAKTEKRRQGRHWTWGAARREGDQLAAEQAATTGAPPRRRPHRRRPQRYTAHEGPASTASSRPPRGRRPSRPAPRTGPAPANEKRRATKPAPRQPATATAGPGGSESPPKPGPTDRGAASERLRHRMRAQRGTSRGPRPTSRTIHSRRRNRQRGRPGTT